MPPVFGPRSPSNSRLWSRAGGSATSPPLPSDSAIRLASGPWSRSSTTTRAEPAAKSRSIAATASSALDATTTPLPAARPSALTTTLPPLRAASSRAYAAAAAGSSNVAARAIATPAASATSWQNAFELSMRAAAAEGPNTRIPASVSASATPAASGASGPTTTSSTARCRATSTIARGSSGSTFARRTRASRAIASDPGATTTSFTPGSAASFQASACSRPPPPTMRIRVGITGIAIASPPPRPAGGSAARPARSSASARARRSAARWGRRPAPRAPRRSAGRSRASRRASGRR